MDWDLKLPVILIAFRSSIASHGFMPHEVMTGVMKTPEYWWVDGAPPDDYQSRLQVDKFMQKLLQDISSIQHNVAIQLKSNARTMHKSLGSSLKSIEWEIGDRMLCRYYSEQGHTFSPRWVGPVCTTNKTSSAIYEIELKGAKGKKQLKWFHWSQLKEWKGARS